MILGDIMLKEFFNDFKTLYMDKILIFIGLLFGMIFFSSIPIILFNLDVANFTTWQFTLYNLTFDIIYMGIVYFIYRKTINENFKDYFKKFGVNFEESFKYYFIGLLIMIGSNLIITLFFPQATPGNEEKLHEYINAYPLYMVFSTVINAPFMEEIIFRKSIKDIFLVKHNNKITKWLYILFSGLLFGAMHIIGQVSSVYDWLFLIPYSALGLAFAMLYYKTDNIFSTVSIHFLNNAISILLFFTTGGL